MGLSERILSVQSAAFASRDSLSAWMTATLLDGDVDAAKAADDAALVALNEALMAVFDEVSA